MSKFVLATAILMAAGVAGCAIHPVPENVTGVSTYHIVRQIRCETRQAVFDTAVGWLTHDEKVSPASRAVGLGFAEQGWPIEKLGPEMLTGRDRAILQLFWNTGIAYTYEFEMEEQNDFNTEINLLKPFTESKRTLGLKAASDRHRQNNRTFTVTDTFGKLVRKMPPKYCDNHLAVANYIYPIAGKIGIAPTIQEFVRLTLFGNLANKEPKGPPTMVDALQFETTISGSATPKVEFSPATNALRVADASLTARVSRRDLHKLTIGLAIDDGSAAQVDRVRSGYLFGPLITATGGTNERVAANAINQYLTTKLFSRSVIVTQ